MTSILSYLDRSIHLLFGYLPFFLSSLTSYCFLLNEKDLSLLDHRIRMGRGGKNSETRSEVANQSSETLVENDSIKGQFTWEEIRRHSSKTDRWLVIDQRVYDVTKWLKHPGGQMLLNHYAGQDATVRISYSIFAFIISFRSGSFPCFSSGNASCAEISQTILYR